MRTKPVIVALLLMVAPFAFSDTITTLYSTGVDDLGNPLAAGVADTHYTVLETSTDAEVMSALPNSYFDNDMDSQWIWQQANGQPTDVTRTFRTTFDLTGFDISTAVIAGAWGVDNIGLDILLNGVSTGISLPAELTTNFSQLNSWIIDTGFVEGVNTLDFVVQDVGFISGFRADLNGSASLAVVPIPAAIYLFGSCLILLFRNQRSLLCRR